ncbi:MAG: hypothetical protein SPI25_00795 [Dialister sp.]|nr:hypothetical protein [Dialister sp.]
MQATFHLIVDSDAEKNGLSARSTPSVQPLNHTKYQERMQLFYKKFMFFFLTLLLLIQPCDLPFYFLVIVIYTHPGISLIHHGFLKKASLCFYRRSYVQRLYKASSPFIFSECSSFFGRSFLRKTYFFVVAGLKTNRRIWSLVFAQKMEYKLAAWLPKALLYTREPPHASTWPLSEWREYTCRPAP